MNRLVRATSSLCVTVAMVLGLGLLACDGGSKSIEPSGATVAAASNKGAAATPGEAGSEQKPAAAEAAGEVDKDAEDAAPSASGPSAPSGEAADADAPSGKSAETEAPTGAEAAEGADEAPEDAPEDAQEEQEPFRVLMLGDSLAATGFGALVEKGLDAHPQVDCYRKGKSASGLARPDFFNWMDESRRQIDFRKPDLVVVIMGGNDGQDLTTKSGKGKRVHWKTHEWQIAYRQRMDDFLARIAGDERQVLWLGLPQMGMRSLEKKLVIIREVQKAAVDALGERGVYVDTTPFLVDEDGKLKEFGKVRGKKKRIRADDGIHFTMSGSQFLANHVVPEILNQLGLAPVEG